MASSTGMNDKELLACTIGICCPGHQGMRFSDRAFAPYCVSPNLSCDVSYQVSSHMQSLGLIELTTFGPGNLLAPWGAATATGLVRSAYSRLKVPLLKKRRMELLSKLKVCVLSCDIQPAQPAFVACCAAVPHLQGIR